MLAPIDDNYGPTQTTPPVTRFARPGVAGDVELVATDVDQLARWLDESRRCPCHAAGQVLSPAQTLKGTG